MSSPSIESTANIQMKEIPPTEGRSTPKQHYFSVLNWQARNICMYEPRTDKVSHSTQQNNSCGISQLSVLIRTKTRALETPAVNSRLWQCRYLQKYESIGTFRGGRKKKKNKQTKRLGFTNLSCFV